MCYIYNMDKTILYKFFSNKASHDEEIQLLKWLDEDSEHERIMFKERSLFDALVMNADKYNEAKIINRSEEPKSRYKLWLREFIKIAAVFLIIFGAGLLYVNEQEDKLTSMMNTISVPAGQQIVITLSDGTKVSMNSCSSLQYPVMFGKNERKVVLKGDAYFDVTHNSEHPFIVETGMYNVEVLGTTFYVGADSVGDRFVTSLIDGKVKVTNVLHPNEEIVLNPNEQAYVSNGKLSVQQIPDYNVFLWRNGLFYFQDMPFEEMLKQIEKYYNVKIISTLAYTPEKMLNGKIKISDGVDHALRVLQNNIQFKYRKEDNTIYIN